MIRNNETDKLQLMFKLMDRVPNEGITPMLTDLEAHIMHIGIADMVKQPVNKKSANVCYLPFLNYFRSNQQIL